MSIPNFNHVFKAGASARKSNLPRIPYKNCAHPNFWYNGYDWQDAVLQTDSPDRPCPEFDIDGKQIN